MLSRDQVDRREEELRSRLRELPDVERKRFYEIAEGRIRDPDTYAVLNYLFISGLHHFYLGKWARGLINLAVFVGGVALLFTEFLRFGVGLILAISAVELYALFRAEVIALDHNNQVMEKILKEMGRD